MTDLLRAVVQEELRPDTNIGWPRYPRGPPAAIVELTHRCWAPDPSARPSMPDVHTALSELAADEEVGATVAATAAPIAPPPAIAR